MNKKRLKALITLSIAFSFWTSCSDENSLTAKKNMEISEGVKSTAVSKTGIETGFSPSNDDNRKYVSVLGYFQLSDGEAWETLNKISYTKNNETTVEFSAPSSSKYQNTIISMINGYSCYSTQNVSELSLGEKSRVDINAQTEIGQVAGYCKIDESKYFLITPVNFNENTFAVNIEYKTTNSELEFIQSLKID